MATTSTNSAPTYEPIATTTLGSGAATITFSSIPSGYTDLRLVYLLSMTTGNGNTSFTINGASTGYSYTGGDYNNNNASWAQSSFQPIQFNSISTTPQLITIDIMNYRGSQYKSGIITLANDLNGSGAVGLTIFGTSISTAINSISVTTSVGTYAIGSTATLYGIKAA